MKCNMNCLSCLLPECINDKISPQELFECDRRDKEILGEDNRKRKYSSEDYLKRKERLNKEELKAYRKSYYEKNKARLQQKARENWRAKHGV